MQPLVSILIPAYNAERWLAQTVRSALAQTWPRREIIIVDDGSKDRTLEVARQFASGEVRVVGQENQGAAAARNAAYALAQGDYIQWLDADDLLSPGKISRQLDAVSRSGASRALLSGEWGLFTYRPARARFLPTALWRDLSPVEWMIFKLRDNLWMQTGVWLVSRELSEAAGRWDPRLLGDDDGEYFSRVVMHCDRIEFVPGAKVYYRRVSESLSHIGMSRKKLEAQFLSIELSLQYMRSMEDSPRTREACLGLLNTWLMTYYPERMDLVERMERMAAGLGGRLDAPRVSWKYAGIQKCFGWSAAKRAQFRYNRVKASALRLWDGALCRLTPHEK
jgi:glycosyltransferase involved in cell wall biosynthesis